LAAAVPSLEKFSTALHWFTEQKTGNKDILHYLDDFLFGAEADSPKCQFTLQTFRDICKVWGVPVTEDKTVEPTEILTFLGIEFDTLAMELRLPNEKLVEWSILSNYSSSPKRSHCDNYNP
jgi:hypothetical protein